MRSRLHLLCLIGVALAAACAGTSATPRHDGSGPAGDMTRPDGHARDATVAPKDMAPADSSHADQKPPAAVTRIAGPNRVATAVAASAAGWSSAATVIVVSGKNTSFPDGLAAPPLAAKHGAPILVTSAAGECAGGDPLVSEVQRLGAKAVIVIGGEAAVSADCFNALAAVAAARRLSGANRYSTAAAVAAEVGAPASKMATIVTGVDFPDGVSAGPVSALAGMPILLVTSSSVPSETSAALSSLGITSTLVVGGPAAVQVSGLPSPSRVYGATRCETSVEVAKYGAASLALGYTTIVVASGASYPDGVTGGGLAARFGGPILLVAGNGELCPGALDFLTRHKQQITTVYIVGGTSAIPASLEQQIKGLL